MNYPTDTHSRDTALPGGAAWLLQPRLALPNACTTQSIYILHTDLYLCLYIYLPHIYIDIYVYMSIYQVKPQRSHVCGATEWNCSLWFDDYSI